MMVVMMKMMLMMKMMAVTILLFEGCNDKRTFIMSRINRKI